MENDKGERIPADGRSGREDDVGRAVLLGIKGDPVPVGMDAVVIDGGNVFVCIAEVLDGDGRVRGKEVQPEADGIAREAFVVGGGGEVEADG